MTDDYFMPETCPFCNATLASDGLHWASGRDDCKTENPDDEDWTPLASRETGESE